jgi:FixJ family two-component response regulator
MSLIRMSCAANEVGAIAGRVAARTRIALIDDDPSVRSAVSRLLRSHDYACTVYESAEMALADPSLISAQCLVIDVQLSGMNGFALRDGLGRDGIHIPCIFITAHADTGSPDWARAIGNNPCVIKPFDESQLLEAIQKAVTQGDQHS